MKKIVVSLLACFAFAHGAFAADAAPAPAANAASAAAVREVLDAMNYRATWSAMVGQMTKAMPGIIRQQTEAALNADTRLTDAQRKERLAKLDADMPKVTEMLAQVMFDPALVVEMEAEMTTLYTRFFTADELKQMAAYYRSPLGTKSLQVMPQVMAESMAIGQRLTAPRIQKAMEQFRKSN
ncbi:DUF2059 domain-containing protein [Pseudoduganella sp.]|uniref:DUF2059 domain-containing protein n=1 Tax=Pseudoduganella sp. TaxID=1880898 RepID=UPI0035AE12AE